MRSSITNNRMYKTTEQDIVSLQPKHKPVSKRGSIRIRTISLINTQFNHNSVFFNDINNLDSWNYIPPLSTNMTSHLPDLSSSLLESSPYNQR